MTERFADPSEPTDPGTPAPPNAHLAADLPRADPWTAAAAHPVPPSAKDEESSAREIDSDAPHAVADRPLDPAFDAPSWFVSPAASGQPAAATVTLEVGPPQRRLFGLRRERSSEPAAPVADWRWVEEWRRQGEPTPWGPGLTLATFAALMIGAAVYVISAGLYDRPVLALAANVVVAAGLTPALWMCRSLPVLRWVALGGAVGTVIAWISVLFFPVFA